MPQVYVVVEGLEIRVVLHHFEVLRARICYWHTLGEAVGNEDLSLLRFSGVGNAGLDDVRRRVPRSFVRRQRHVFLLRAIDRFGLDTPESRVIWACFLLRLCGLALREIL